MADKPILSDAQKKAQAKELLLLKKKEANEKKKADAIKVAKRANAEKVKAEKLHQSRLQTDAKYRHDYEIASKKKWRESRVENTAKENEILDQKAKNERNWSDVREKNEADAVKNRKKGEEAHLSDIAEGKAERSAAGVLAEKLAQAKEKTSMAADEGSLESKLKGMSGLFKDEESKENQQLLLDQFKSVTLQLKDPALAPLERQVLEGELDQISKGADAEEERREKQQVVDDQNNYFKQMAEGINRTAEGFDSFRDGMMKGGGIIAALGAIALIFFDPETLMAGITKGLQKISDIIAAVKGILSGDEDSIEEGWKTLKDNAGILGVAVVAIGIMIAGPVTAGIATISSGFGAVKSAAIASGNVIRGMVPDIKAAGTKISGVGGRAVTMLKSIGTALRLAALAAGTVLTTMFSSMVAFLAPFAIPIAIALAIVAVVAAIGYALTKLRDALGFGSVMDVIILGAMYIKDAFAVVGNWMISLRNKILGWMPKSWQDKAGGEMELLSTDNAKNFKAKAQQEKIDADLAAAAAIEIEANKEDIYSDVPSFDDIPNQPTALDGTDPNGLGLNLSQLMGNTVNVEEAMAEPEGPFRPTSTNEMTSRNFLPAGDKTHLHELQKANVKLIADGQDKIYSGARNKNALKAAAAQTSITNNDNTLHSVTNILSPAASRNFLGRKGGWQNRP